MSQKVSWIELILFCSTRGDSTQVSQIDSF